MKLKVINVDSIENPITDAPGFKKKDLADKKLDLMGRCSFQCSYCSSNSGLSLTFRKRSIAAAALEQLGETVDVTRDPGVAVMWPDVIKRLDLQLARKPVTWGAGQTLVVSMLTDAFSPLPLAAGITERALLEVFKRTDFRVRILTKSAVVASPKWLRFFQDYRDRVVVGLSIGSLDRAWAEAVEVGTSSPQARLEALRRLQDAGVPTFGMMCPIFPDALEGLDELIESIRPELCETVWAEPYNDRQNWKAVRDGYAAGSQGRGWLDEIYGDGAQVPLVAPARSGKKLWSYYATLLYRRLWSRAATDGWLPKLKYLLYEQDITEGDARSFYGLEGVLLQSKPADDGWSRNPFMAAHQIQSPAGLVEEGSFSSFTQWVNHAKSRFEGRPPGALHFFDAKGRRCNEGNDFQRARDDHSFPVTYYRRKTPEELMGTSAAPSEQQSLPLE